MKYCLYIIIALFSFTTVFTQVNYNNQKIGGYLSFEDYKSNRPYYTYTFNVERRSQEEIFMNGGNDYKITCDSLKKNVINKDIWGVFDGKDFYINCRSFSNSNHFARFEREENNEIYFYAWVDPKIVVGGAIGGAVSATKRGLHIFYKRSGGIMSTGNPRPQ